MSESDSEYDEKSFSTAIKKLQTKDPEFYEFLKENDEKLLEFGESEDEVSNEENEVLNEALDNSDNDENDSDAASGKSPKLTISEIENLKQQVQTSPTSQVCKELINLMNVAVSQATGTENQSRSFVNGDVFNEAVKLCLVELAPALYKVLKLNQNSDPHSICPSKSKSWKKLLTTVKSYLTDVLKLMNFISEPASLKQILKHIVNLVPFFAEFIKLIRVLLKKMTEIWSTSEESVRVSALLVIVRGHKRLPAEYQKQQLKQMYFAYVRNSRFNSASTTAFISFMKHSLVEIYAMNPGVAYEHCFIYLRQLCIHLRNAIITKKKETFQTVYNWQYVHCLQFWTLLVSKQYNNEAIKTLAYPLVQTILGTINLIPTVKYVPLRFHLARALIQLSKDTGIYIPVASIISGALDLTDFNKKSTFSKKPINFTCALKASKAQLLESGYKDGIVIEVCSLLTEYFSVYAHTIAFPELVLPTIVNLKSFMKKTKVSKYGQQLKSVIDKLQVNSDYISQQRKHVSFKMTDFEQIDRWEENMKQQALPFFSAKRCNSSTPQAAKKIKLVE